jgi:hypothetical protein
MATPESNEKQLDFAEKIIKDVLQDVRRNITKYSNQDYSKLLNAWIALNKVTLRPDSDFEKLGA